MAPFFWSGKAHGQQRNTHLQSCSIAPWRSWSCLPFISRGTSFNRGRWCCFWCLADPICCLGLEARGYRNGLVPGESMRGFRLVLAYVGPLQFSMQAKLWSSSSSEDGWADCDLRGVAWPVVAVAEGRYDLLLQAHISKRGDGCLACDLR